MTYRTSAIIVGIALLLLSACRRQGPPSGVSYDTGDSAIRVVAIMPGCGCLSLTNTADARVMPPGQSSGLELVASLSGRETGKVVLLPGQEHTEKFDWAGPSSTDQYDLVAYTRRSDGSRGERLAPIDRYVRAAQLVSGCAEAVCAFGPLALDAALHAHLR